MNWFDNLSLGLKIILALVLVAAVPLVIVGGYSASVTEEALIEASVREMESRTRIEAARVEARLDGLRSDVLFLSNVPPIQGIVRARDGGGFDRDGVSSYTQWVDRLNVIFSRFGEAKPEYLQLRYLDEIGNKMVRVNVKDGTPTVVRGEFLQDKADSVYFRRTMSRQAASVYVSPMTPNVEHGRIEMPIVPVVRFSVSIFDEAGTPRGVVILNVSGHAILSDLVDEEDPDAPTNYVVNSNGYYLLHPDTDPDTEKTWGLQRGYRYSVVDDFHVFTKALLQPTTGFIANVDGRVITHASIHPDRTDRSQYWKIVQAIPRAQILGASRLFKVVFAALLMASLAAAIGSGVWLSRRWFIGPLLDLVDVTNRIASGDVRARVPVRRRDEMGQLAVAFNGMGQALQEARENLERRVEQRTAELHDSEKRFRTILEVAMDGIITIDERGAIRSYNQAAERIFGFSADEVIGQNVSMLMPAPFRSQHQTIVDRYMVSRRSQFIDSVREMTGQHKDGTTFPVDLAVTEARLGGGTLFVGILRDITERKQAEGALYEAKQYAELANRSKSEFLANMSHELRTPLNAIIGFSELIRSETFGPVGSAKYLEYVCDINDSGEHLLELINDILDLSKVEAGKLELQEEEIDIARVVQSCLTLIKERAETAGVEIDRQIPPVLPSLSADSRKLKQILLNLLSNAIKFTPAGGRVVLRVAAAPDDGVCFSVADTGIGIAPDDIDKVMSPFGQVDGALSRTHQGTGLGLPLTKALVELHGGTLELESEVGTGTTVTVHLPSAEMRRRASA